MPFLDEIYIGAFAGGVNGMVPVSSLGEDTYSTAIVEGAFTVDPVHYSQTIITAAGEEVEQGWLQCLWHINGLKAAQYDDLVAFRVAHTTDVYIRTLDNDGATYKNFLAKMIWPTKLIREDPTAVTPGNIFDFTIKFIQCIEQV
jgi:hypothetical protein